MALYWGEDPARRHADPAQLVAFLSPPAPADEAQTALRRIWRQLANELHEERTERQSAKQVKKELEGLRRALDRLSPRTRTVLRRAIGPLSKRLPAYPPLQEPLFPGSEGRLHGDFVLHLLNVATEQALEATPHLRRGNPGKISDATRRGICALVKLYCDCHSAPLPSWDFFAEQVRHPAPLEFAFECLRAWYVPGINRLEPEDVARSLHNYSA